jgi:hypothetical protein
LVRIITTSTLQEGSVRIDFFLEQSHDLALASKTIAEERAKVFGLGTYRAS